MLARPLAKPTSIFSAMFAVSRSRSSFATHDGAAKVRAEPFAAIELELGGLWR